MSLDDTDFVHPNHLRIFIAAAQAFDCHILVRQTGKASLAWVGKRGYTGKRADLKAKTANRNVGRHQLAGLVCSPFLLPQVFTESRLADARSKWLESSHLITLPRTAAGFDDDEQPRGCQTPYLVQTNPRHRHYGCIVLVEIGLLRPRYVHGDYDLYAIIPAGQRFDPNTLVVRRSTLGSKMSPDSLSQQQLLRLETANLEGPLSFRVATYINTCISKTSPDLLGALMVNHGEQLNIGKAGHTFEAVLAVMPKPINGQWTRILTTREDHQQFYLGA